MKINYFDYLNALKIHDEIINKSGGLLGIRDSGTLKSILQHTENNEYYPEFEDKLTHLFYAINKSHCFVDGNKRASIALSAYFMELNSFDHLVANFIVTMEQIAIDVANNEITKDMLGEIIFRFLYNEYNIE